MRKVSLAVKGLLYLLISPLVALGVGVYFGNMLLWESSKLTLSFVKWEGPDKPLYFPEIELLVLKLKITVRTLPHHDW